MKVYVNLTSYTEVTREHDPSDRWSGEDTYTSWTVTGLSRNKPNGNYRAVDIEYEPTGIVYLVFAVYSTGDSFGLAEGGGFEVIDLYQTYEEASACANALEKDKKNFVKIKELNEIVKMSNLGCSLILIALLMFYSLLGLRK